MKNIKKQLPVDYFQFYNSISSVYSSKIEGENIDYDSYFKYKFLIVKNYFINRKDYYRNIRKPGLDYETLDYTQALDFTLMTIKSLKKE